MNTLFRAWSHFQTITRHRHAVIRHCFRAGIPWRGLMHDLSKYTPTEFLSGVRFYTDGTKSPNEKERECYGYSKAWMHHKGRNRHHFEYWSDYNPKIKKVMPVRMPTKFLKELICDRVAASKIYQGKNYTDTHPLEYFLAGKDRRVIEEETSKTIESVLTVLKNEGEDAMFCYLKKMK